MIVRSGSNALAWLWRL